MTIDIDMLDPLCEGNITPQAMNWTHIIVHHTGAEEEDAAQVRRAHLSRGFIDIGYNAVIETDGNIVLGRPLTLPGAHAKGWNSKAIGVALIGNLEVRYPHPSQLLSLQGLLFRLAAEYKIPPQNIWPHDRVVATACPGKLFNLSYLRPIPPPLTMVVNGKAITTPTRITPSGRSEMLIAGHWIPVRDVVDALGGTVKWSADKRIIDVSI